MKSTKFIFVKGVDGFKILRPFVFLEDMPLLRVLDENEDFKYVVKDIMIPNWMDAEEYSKNYIKYLFSVECGYKEEMGEDAYRQFCAYGTVYRLAIYELLSTKTFRSGFRGKMRASVDAWLAQKSHERRFGSPLTVNQMQCLLNDRIKKAAIKLDTSWHYRHNYAKDLRKSI